MSALKRLTEGDFTFIREKLQAVFTERSMAYLPPDRKADTLIERLKREISLLPEFEAGSLNQVLDTESLTLPGYPWMGDAARERARERADKVREDLRPYIEPSLTKTKVEGEFKPEYTEQEEKDRAAEKDALLGPTPVVNWANNTVLMQLFVGGPTWDGDLVSKADRDMLVEDGYVGRWNGWNFLNAEGVKLAVVIGAKTKHFPDSRWYRKAVNHPARPWPVDPRDVAPTAKPAVEDLAVIAGKLGTQINKLGEFMRTTVPGRSAVKDPEAVDAAIDWMLRHLHDAPSVHEPFIEMKRHDEDDVWLCRLRDRYDGSVYAGVGTTRQDALKQAAATWHALTVVEPPAAPTEDGSQLAGHTTTINFQLTDSGAWRCMLGEGTGYVGYGKSKADAMEAAACSWRNWGNVRG